MGANEVSVVSLSARLAVRGLPASIALLDTFNKEEP
jgi:hypothetical protein